MNEAQENALRERFNEKFDASKFGPVWDLPVDWVAGWVGSIYVGCSPEGRISS